MDKARKHLSQDPVLKEIVAKHPVPQWSDPPAGGEGLFQKIVENILGQQLSGKAADTIARRFVDKFNQPAGEAGFKKGRDFPTPEQILAMPDQEIRNCGTSWAKVSYIKNFSQAIVSDSPDLEKIKTLPDETVIAELTKIKGIGKWTAEMILIFYLHRPDVFSLGDQGLRNAVAKLYGVDKNNLKKIEKISLSWSPHRSLACRYLWMSLDNEK